MRSLGLMTLLCCSLAFLCVRSSSFASFSAIFLVTWTIFSHSYFTFLYIHNTQSANEFERNRRTALHSQEVGAGRRLPSCLHQHQLLQLPSSLSYPSVISKNPRRVPNWIARQLRSFSDPLANNFSRRAHRRRLLPPRCCLSRPTRSIATQSCCSRTKRSSMGCDNGHRFWLTSFPWLPSNPTLTRT